MESKNLSAEEAKAKIADLTTAEEINTFVDGDDRVTVMKAAEKRFEELKQGEAGNITQKDNGLFKGAPIVKKTSVITMRDNKPKRVFFDEKGKESGVEDA